MTFNNHITMGAIVGIEILSVMGGEITSTLQSGSLTFFVGVLIGSIATDWDEPNSKASKVFNMRHISEIITRVCGGHRGLFHTLIVPFTILMLCTLSARFFGLGYVNIFFVGLAIGMVVHQFGDLFTKSGIKGWANPFAFIPKVRKESSNFAIGPKKFRFVTGGKIESVILVLNLFILGFVIFTNDIGNLLF